MVDICLTIDRNYERMARACINEIVRHADAFTHFHFYILAYDLVEPDLFHRFKKYQNVDVSLEVVNPFKYFHLRSRSNLRYLTPTMYLRCLIPELDIIPNYGKILYLDPDIFTLKDILSLYEEDLNGNLIGAIKDFGVLNVWGDKTISPEKYTHFCSGVMLMDIAKLNAFDFTTKCIKAIDGTLPDQPIINDVLKGHVQYLPPKYSFSYHKILQGVREYGDISLWNRTYGTNYRSIEELKNDAVLIHCHGDKAEQQKTPALKKMYDDAYWFADEFLSR